MTFSRFRFPSWSPLAVASTLSAVVAACSGSTGSPTGGAGTGGAAGAPSGGADTGGTSSGGSKPQTGGSGGKSGSGGGKSTGGMGGAGFECPDSCDDGDPCTEDSCSAAGCEHTPRSGRVTVAPATATLVVENGAAASETFAASWEDTDVTSCVSWSLGASPTAFLEGTTLTATGLAGGPVALTAQLGSESVTTNVAVRLVETRNTGAVSETDVDALDEPSETPDPTLAILYPYDGTVFPLGVRPPKLQFQGGAASDVYKLVVESDFFSYVDYISANPPSRFDLSEAVWQKLGASGQGAKADAVTVTLTRRSAGVTYAPVTQTWRIAQAKLHGEVYYNETSGSCSSPTGDVRTIPIGATTATTVTTGCAACHTVSRDGRNLLASYDVGSPFPFKLTDVRAGTTQPFDTAVRGTFGAFNPAGDKALVSHDNAAGHRKMSIVSVPSGEVLAENVLGAACGEPAWSPDGRHVASICNLTGSGWIFDASNGDLMLGEVAEDGVTVGEGSVFAPQAGGNGRPAYPSFSGDSTLLAYGRTTAGSRSTGNGELWLAALDGSFETQLLNLKSTSTKNFYPSFAPYRAGGYYWMAFTSRRAYGNVITVSANLPQIWIAAIDETLEGDPSRPPFYLEGQQTCAGAYRTDFARSACLDEGEVCESGVDCCGGTCLVTAPDDEARCTPQPEDECVAEYNACAEDTDCCGAPAMICVDRICQSAKR